MKFEKRKVWSFEKLVWEANAYRAMLNIINDFSVTEKFLIDFTCDFKKWLL